MPLEEYVKKRDFTKTSEPLPLETIKSAGKDLIFAIHEHHASHLHWDLRLEHDGVLKSWAVPKEPPLAERIKRLAVQVEDHPLDYAKFEGTIPEGQYGAGVVKIWDCGTYMPEKFSGKEIIADFHGKKLLGKYVLLKTAFNGAKNSWLFFKKNK
ncbi:MAG: DNA polymerase ligase N-terminal domain-containing protein [Nanoarchaeota archaeon]|nr:3'-phosphoesterase [Nanoarchaeota archaeon]MBU4299943.1 3'-phosphoesterase [Nanoarchaeota archaeon]MBU4451308.1 3'-phosphoesterase [Nanoarchaeota archaeon]MCG2723679.1 3'-phosphoesterase [archaeon]